MVTLQQRIIDFCGWVVSKKKYLIIEFNAIRFRAFL